MDRLVDESKAAVGFLTRIPIGRVVLDRPGASAFSVVGAALGSVAALPLIALMELGREPLLGAIAAVGVMVVLTGAIHLDGLADTADALVARDALAAERARKDPAVGPAGLATILLVLLAEVASLSSIASSQAVVAAWTTVAAGGLARVAPVMLVRAARTEPRSNGLGSWFIRGVTARDVTIVVASAGLLVTMLALATSTSIAHAALVGCVIGLAIGFVLIDRRGGPDGDSLGGSVELTFAATVAAVALVVH